MWRAVLQCVALSAVVVMQMISFFQYFDADATGRLTTEQFRRLHADLVLNGFQLPECDAVREKVDSDSDGYVSFNEFVAWYRTQI